MATASLERRPTILIIDQHAEHLFGLVHTIRRVVGFDYDVKMTITPERALAYAEKCHVVLCIAEVRPLLSGGVEPFVSRLRERAPTARVFLSAPAALTGGAGLLAQVDAVLEWPIESEKISPLLKAQLTQRSAAD